MVFGQISIFLTILICFVNLAAARQIYVAPSGGRSNGSGTIDNPLDTLGQALEQGLRGDTIVVRGESTKRAIFGIPDREESRALSSRLTDTRTNGQ